MAPRNERKQAAARHKKKVKRAKAQHARKQRTRRASGGVSQAATWPVGEAYLSDNWHEWEATVHGVVGRTHADGTTALVGITVDLAQQGLTQLDVRVGLPSNQVGAWAATQTDDAAMFSADPAAVARLFHDGLSLARAAGRPDPKGLERALTLLGDVDPDESPYDYHLGFEDDDEPTEEVKKGFFGRLFGGA